MVGEKSDNDLFKQAFEISPNVITITSLELGVYMEVNPAFERITGYSRDEVIGKTVTEIGIWADANFREEFTGHLIENNEVAKLEGRFRRKDGTIGHLLVSAKTIIYNDVLCIFGFFEDISIQKEKEQELNQTIENLPLGIFKSTYDGRVIFANPAMANIYGFDSVDEMLARPASDYYSENSERELMLQKLEESGVLLNYITLEQKKDGSKIWISTNYKGTFDQNNKLEFIEGIIEDITERRSTEESLRESEERFRELFENSHTILILVDVDTKFIIEGNAAAANFYGCNLEELKNICLYDCVVDTPEVIDAEIQQIKDEKGRLLTSQIIVADGSIRKIELYAGFINTLKGKILYAFVYDLTEQTIERKKFEIFNEAINQSFSCVVITDRNAKIEFVNPAFTRISGYSSEDAIGRNPSFHKSGLMDEQTYKELWETITSGKSWTGEFTNKRKNGEIYWENATVSPVVDREGNISHFIAIKDEITEQKKLIHDLVIAKEKAEESNKLKSAFLANMSHEIRTPLNSIVGFTELFMDDDLSKDQLAEFKRYIIESSDQLLSVVNDVLDISLISTQQLSIFNETFDINTFVTETSVNFTKSISNKGLKFNIVKSMESGVCQINSDFNKLKQIFEKLFNNAIKYTQEGEITFGYEYIDNSIRLFIKDTGIGIPADRQDLIYESFSQGTNELSRKFGGLGLGLSIAKQICKLLEIDIQFDSSPGEGTTFYVILPPSYIKILHVEQSINPEINASVNNLRSLKIMIVEDDIPSFDYLKTILERFGLEVFHIESGDKVLHCYQENEDIQLVIMDIRIPRLDGWQATRLLKNYNPNLPVIALSAFANDGDMQRAQLSGADMFLTKPTRPEVLIKHIIELTNRSS